VFVAEIEGNSILIMSPNTTQLQNDLNIDFEQTSGV
jgi:hypothetical protein